MTIQIPIPEPVVKVIEELELHGYPSYLVGGYVRDRILDTESNRQITEDFDIATSATPEEIKVIFRNDKLFAYGERHGTVTLRRSGINFEITTFREEEGYTDGRRPDNVRFIRDLTTDLARRDFTVNAFALEKDGSIIDYFEGLTDIENKIIRAVGDPVERFKEDSLRILRAVRFAVKLGFNIDNDTKIAIKENRHLILEHQLSGERIFTELNGIMKNLPRGVMLLHELDLLSILFPDLHKGDKIEWLFKLMKTKKYLENQPTSEIINWAILFHYMLYEVVSNNIPTNIRKIFSKYRGIGNQRMDYLIHLLLYVRSFYNIVNLNNSIVKAVTFGISNTLHVSTNIDMFFQELFKLLYIVDDRWGTKNISNLEKTVNAFLPNLALTIPVDGNDLVSIGYEGKNIGTILFLAKILYVNNPTMDKFHLLDYINGLNFTKSMFHMDDYLAAYNLNPDDLFDDFVMESLLAKMKNEYLLAAKQKNAVVIDVTKNHFAFIMPFLKGIGKKNIIINSEKEVDKNIKEKLDILKISHIGLKYHWKDSIETLSEVSLVDGSTVIFNVI